MAGSAFTFGVKPGGLTENTEVRILLCYLIKTVAPMAPLTRAEIEQALLGEQLVNYFELSAGLAERCEGLRPGQPVSVFIKSILPEKMKIKLVIVNRELAGPLFFAPRYFITEGRLEHWVYSTPGSKKRIETDFGPAAL